MFLLHVFNIITSYSINKFYLLIKYTLHVLIFNFVFLFQLQLWAKESTLQSYKSTHQKNNATLLKENVKFFLLDSQPLLNYTFWLNIFICHIKWGLHDRSGMSEQSLISMHCFNSVKCISWIFMNPFQTHRTL